jgi:protein TonB
MKRSTCISVAFHLLLVAIGVIVNYWPASGVTGTPQEEEIMNVTFIPLSALDTVLPKGAPLEPLPNSEPPPKAPELQDKPKPKVKTDPPKKIVSVKSLSSTTITPQQSNSSDTATESAPTSGSQQIGVANGQAVSLEQARISYQDMVATLLARAKRYPERALKRRMTGEGTIRIEISSDGSLSDFEIVRSTEMPVLDEELRAMVERAAPFPAFPGDLRKNSLALVVPVAFKLQS